MKKTVLYIIESLGLGGAEMMVVSQLAQVHKEYNIVLVILSPVNQFRPEQLVYDEFYCLNMKRKINVISASKKLRQIIHKHDVALVHSVLFWSTIVARIACGTRTPHICSLATIMSRGAYSAKWYSGYTWLLDKMTYKKSETLIGASHEVLKDFDEAIGIKGRQRVLHNFVNDEFFYNAIEYKNPETELKLVAVGNLKDEKNYQYLIDAFILLKHDNVSIDIYGQGNLYKPLQDQIDKLNIKINLKGLQNNIHKILPSYNAYVMCSKFEGFGIAAAEAMAIGLPLLLSDIAVLKEVSAGNALYFDIGNPQDFVNIIRNILQSKTDLICLSEKGKHIAKENYTKATYIKGLLEIFNQVITDKQNKAKAFAAA